MEVQFNLEKVGSGGHHWLKSSQRARVRVHGGGGNVLIYRDLSRHLGLDQTVFGFQSQGLDGQQPCLNSIEEMAARYLRELKLQQPKGPYYLGGYCLGGTVALEMARQLADSGDRVGMVALFDTINWG
jgi:thioesterase domain-containing protein